jgi:hypothetical protein
VHSHRQSEDRAIARGPAAGRCSVELTRGSLDQRPSWERTVCAIAFGAKTVKRRQRAARGDFEDRPSVVGQPAGFRRPVEVPRR